MKRLRASRSPVRSRPRALWQLHGCARLKRMAHRASVKVELSGCKAIDMPGTCSAEGLAMSAATGRAPPRPRELKCVCALRQPVPLTRESLSRAAQNDAVCCGPNADAVDRCAGDGLFSTKPNQNQIDVVPPQRASSEIEVCNLRCPHPTPALLLPCSGASPSEVCRLRCHVCAARRGWGGGLVSRLAPSSQPARTRPPRHACHARASSQEGAQAPARRRARKRKSLCVSCSSLPGAPDRCSCSYGPACSTGHSEVRT